MVQLRLYVNFRKVIKRLSYEEKGMLLDAMLAYAKDKTLLPLEGKADIIWDFVQEMLDAQHAAYDNKCAGAEKSRNKKLIGVDIKSNQDESTQDNLSLSNFEVQKQIQIQKQEQDKLSKKRYGNSRERKSNFVERTPPTEDELKSIGFFLNLDNLDGMNLDDLTEKTKGV